MRASLGPSIHAACWAHTKLSTPEIRNSDDETISISCLSLPLRRSRTCPPLRRSNSPLLVLRCRPLQRRRKPRQNRTSRSRYPKRRSRCRRRRTRPCGTLRRPATSRKSKGMPQPIHPPVSTTMGWAIVGRLVPPPASCAPPGRRHCTRAHRSLSSSRRLKEEGADVNFMHTQKPPGRIRQFTPLHIATHNKHLDVVKYLVEKGGASLNAKCAYGESAYEHSRGRSGMEEVSAYLKLKVAAEAIMAANRFKVGRFPGHTRMHCTSERSACVKHSHTAKRTPCVLPLAKALKCGMCCASPRPLFRPLSARCAYLLSLRTGQGPCRQIEEE